MYYYFSGDEYDYVILSTVRSLPLEEIEDHRLVEADRRWKRENLGFLTDNHLINVALTRAKQGLIIIGKVTHIITYYSSICVFFCLGNSTLLMYDTETWKPLIKLYEDKNCLVKGNEFIKKHRTALR